MKKLILVVMTSLIALSSSFNSLSADVTDQIISESAVVVDVKTGQVIYEKNMNDIKFPASITKILTCALAMDKGFDDKSTVTMTDDAIWSVGRDTTHIALTPGEIVSVKDLLYTTMLQSANDSANGLALYVSGSVEAFSATMNEKALEAGALNTNFTNANGLPDDNHVTTAYDMAMITRWALGIDGFRELFGTQTYSMSPTNKQESERNFVNKHKMLFSNDKNYYEYATGGKLGWTEEAMHTSVTVAEKDGMELICVTMKSKDADTKYSDTKLLLDTAFKNFNHVTYNPERFQQGPIPIYKDDAKIGEIQIQPEEITILKPSTSAKADIKIDLNLPIRYEDNGEISPRVSFILDDKVIAEVPFKYTRTDFDMPVSLLSVSKENPAPKNSAAWVFFALAVFSLAIAVLFIIRSLNIIKQNKKLSKRERLSKLRSVESRIIDENRRDNTILFPQVNPKNIKNRPSTAKRLKSRR